MVRSRAVRKGWWNWMPTMNYITRRRCRKLIITLYASLAASLNSTINAVDLEERRSDAIELFLLIQLEIKFLLDRQ